MNDTINPKLDTGDKVLISSTSHTMSSMKVAEMWDGKRVLLEGKIGTIVEVQSEHTYGHLVEVDGIQTYLSSWQFEKLENV